MSWAKPRPSAELDPNLIVRHYQRVAVGRIGARAEGAKPTYDTVNRRAPMPNLENLRKQAKLVLRWHRERYYPVAAQIRAVLPRFAHLSDREILAATFKLGDAQELVARRQGFESWQALEQRVASMPEQRARPDRARTRPVISATAAQLFVADIEASCAFFKEKLGFSVVFAYGKPPFYAQVKRDGGLLNLRCVDRPVIDPQLRDREILLSADMGGHVRGDQGAVHRVPGRRCDVLPDAQEGAVGRQDVHRQGPRRKPAAIRGTGRMRPPPPPCLAPTQADAT